MFPTVYFARFKIDDMFGGTAVVVAYSEDTAREKLEADLRESGYEAQRILLYEIDINDCSVQIVDYCL